MRLLGLVLGDRFEILRYAFLIRGGNGVLEEIARGGLLLFLFNLGCQLGFDGLDRLDQVSQVARPDRKLFRTLRCFTRSSAGAYSALPPFSLSRNSLPVRKNGARFSPTETGSPVRSTTSVKEFDP